MSTTRSGNPCTPDDPRGRGGRRTEELTTEQRTELDAVLREAQQIWGEQIVVDRWTEIAPKMAELGKLLRALADAREDARPSDDLKAKIEKRRQRLLSLPHPKALVALAAELGFVPGDLERLPAGVAAVMEALGAIDAMEPTQLRALALTLVSAAEKFTGEQLPRWNKLRSGTRRGDTGKLPRLDRAALLAWMRQQKPSPTAVARRLVDLGLESGLVRELNTHDHVGRIARNLTKALTDEK